jgi:hypothetical protein
VRALLTDSIEVGPSNWTPRLIEQFKKLRGYDPTPYLPALAGYIVQSRADSDKFLYDFRRTLADLIASEHYGTVAQVARDNGMIVYGEALEWERPLIGDDMAMRSHTTVPMSALWTFGKGQKAFPGLIADMRGAASVAHLYGQNIVAAESMTSFMSPWAFAPADLRRVIDLAFVTGINRPVIHTSVHQPVNDKKPGLSLSIFGQYFNRHETWAEMAKPWIDYISRSSFLLQQGTASADILYFYGEEAPLTQIFSAKLNTDVPDGYAFDYANPNVLADVLFVENGELVSRGGTRYRVLYLGGMSQRLTLRTLRHLEKLVDAGATLIGIAPEESPSLTGDPSEYRVLVQKLWGDGRITKFGHGRVIADTNLTNVLSEIGVPPDFTYSKTRPSSDIQFLHRTTDDEEIFFLSNRSADPDQLEARFRVQGKTPEIWRADAGTIERVSFKLEDGYTVVPLNFRGEESYFVIFRKAATAQSLQLAFPSCGPNAALANPWIVEFESAQDMLPSLEMDKLLPLSENNDPRVKYFSGVARYTSSFTVSGQHRRGQPLLLSLGQVGDIAEVRVNNVLMGTAWHAPWEVDIGAAAKPGPNTIEIRVANLWVNRLIGDQQPGANGATWTSQPTYLPNAPLRPAGLIGPVNIAQCGR